MAQNNQNDQNVQKQNDQQTPQKPTVVEGLVKNDNKEQTPETNRTKEHDDTNHPHKQDTPKTGRTQDEQPQQEVDPNRTTL